MDAKVGNQNGLGRLALEPEAAVTYNESGKDAIFKTHLGAAAELAFSKC